MYDIVIIGGGPAGITAGIYGIRSGLKTLVIEKENVGGQVINTYEIRNFPTYINLSGVDFCTKLYEQADYNGLEVKSEQVISVDLMNDVKIIKTENNVYEAKSVIIASGGVSRKLGLENEDKFIGRGISFCALCDGNFFKDKTVAIVGGGDNAMEDAMYLSSLCKKVYLINRSEQFRAQVILQNALKENMNKNKNVEILYNAQVSKLYGDNLLQGIDVTFTDGSTKNLSLDGLFLAIGKIPDTKILEGQVELNKNGYIIVDRNMKTNLKGVFAGGDCTEKTVRQIITACSDGAICATCANNYIKGE